MTARGRGLWSQFVAAVNRIVTGETKLHRRLRIEIVVALAALAFWLVWRWL